MGNKPWLPLSKLLKISVFEKSDTIENSALLESKEPQVSAHHAEDASALDEKAVSYEPE